MRPTSEARTAAWRAGPGPDRTGRFSKLPVTTAGRTVLQSESRARRSGSSAESKAERQAVEVAAQEALRHEGAMRQASKILKNASGDPRQHPYWIKKHVNFGSAVKRGPWPQRGWQDALLIPGYDADQRISTIEAINQDGSKDSLAGGRKRGAILPIKPFRHADLVVIAEGVANAAAGAESCSSSAVAALGASNLLEAGRIVRGLNLSAKIAFLADHDPNGTGLKYARAAAAEVGGVVVDLSGLLPDAKFDAWDLFDRLGLDALGRAIVKSVKDGPVAPGEVDDAPENDVPPAEPAPTSQDAGDGETQDPSLQTGERDEVRRQMQKEENDRIQELHDGVMFPSRMTVEEMAERLYWVAEGEVVAHVSENRTMFLKFSEFRSLTTESVTSVSSDGSKKRVVPNSLLWKGDQRRKNVMAPTFRAGSGVVCADPDGKKCVNLWRPTKRWGSKADIDPFLDHVEYLIEDDAEREVFLDWLAHLEQNPGELPHYGWLHIASYTGCGRNWLASVLARVWRGYVAPNVDLHSLLDSQYNGVLSGRILAMVDEIQAGDGGNYRHKNRLREMLNQEVQNMNPKFGRQYSEHNSCRWLVFSNHLNALPIDNTDRRWRVVVHNQPPRAPDVYAKLYALLGDHEFINAVAVFLRNRDISNFKPGERPPMNKSKLAVVTAMKTPMQQIAEEIVEHWPVAVIRNTAISFPSFRLGMTSRKSLLPCGTAWATLGR
jgi:phage/plasmid primase-like uncharacterized protein